MVNKNRNVITINLQGDIGEIFRDRELFIYQYDDGQELYFPDYEELGISEVQFANENSGEAIRREMTDGYVQIPYSLLSQNRPIFAYVMCITSDSTTTMIKLIIQNNCRVIAEDAIDPEDEQTFREWVQEQIDGKQDALVAGENITIENNVISATGGGRVNELDDLEDVDVASATNGQYLVYDNGEWTNADGLTESRVNLLIDNKLIPFSKVFNATTIRFDAQSFSLEIQIDDTVTSFKTTDIIILKLSNVTIPEGQCRRISVFNRGGQFIATYNFAIFPDLINGAFYLIRFDNGYADIISSSVITSDNVSGLTALLNAKQNVLTAGTGITIDGDVISAVGGGSDIYVNVKDFGATGDGVTDDSTAIQSALTSLESTGGTIFFPTGTYLLGSAVKFYSNQILLFDNATLKRGADINNLLRNYNDGETGAYGMTSNVRIIGATFDADGTNVDYTEECTTLGFSHSENVSIENCRFLNGAKKWHDLEVNSSRYVTISNCYFDGTNKISGYYEQLQIDRFNDAGGFPWEGVADGTTSKFVRVVGNTFVGNTHSAYVGGHNGGAVEDIEIEGNTFIGNTSNYGAIYFLTCLRLRVHDNVFNGCTNGVVAGNVQVYNTSSVFDNKFVGVTNFIKPSGDKIGINYNNLVNGSLVGGDVALTSELEHTYTAYFLSQTTESDKNYFNVVLDDADDSSFSTKYHDFVIINIDSSDTIPTTVPDYIRFYANDEETVVETRNFPSTEQFIAGNKYMLMKDLNAYWLISPIVSTVAQVNALIDAKINALGYAEEEAF